MAGHADRPATLQRGVPFAGLGHGCEHVCRHMLGPSRITEYTAPLRTHTHAHTHGYTDRAALLWALQAISQAASLDQV